MASKSITSFAGGLLVATGVLGAVYFFGPDDAAKTEPSKEPTVKEMKESLLDKGYVIQTEEEWKAHENELSEAKLAQETPKEETKEKIVYRSVIKVSKGMTSIDVGKNLKKARIIKDAYAFTKQVDSKGVANGLRPGTYVVDSKMTTDEIIAVIFK